MEKDDNDRRPSKDTGKRGFRPGVEYINQHPGARGLIVGPEGIFVHRDGKLETRFDAVDFFWAGVATAPGEWATARLGYDYLLKHAADASREDLRRTINWFELAIAQRDRFAAVAAARYLQAMPLELLASDNARLTGVFDSRIVGMVWRVTPDLDVGPLPPRIPKFGQEAGYGMIRSVPELYLKLAMLSPEMEEMVVRLAAEALRYAVTLPPELTAMVPPPIAIE